MWNGFFRRAAAALGLGALLVGTPATAKAPQAAQPALWKVSDADTTIYLFGTIHLLPEDLKWRSQAFDKAVGDSQQLVIETIVDQQNPVSVQQAELKLGFAQGLPPIVQRVPPAQAAALRAAITKSGIPEQYFNQMKTWLAAITLLSMQFRDMGLKGTAGPEEKLRQQFLSEHKAIGQLESNEEQFTYFDRMSEKAQRDLLLGAVEPQEAVAKDFGGMLASWSRGDVKGIALTFNHELSQSPEIRNILLRERNANWAKWIEHRMTQPGTIIVAVGAGHLAGPESVIAKLQRDGYRVRRVQ